MFDQHIVLCLQRHVDIGTTLLSFVGMHRITIILTHWQVCKGKGKGSFYIAQYPVHWTTFLMDIILDSVALSYQFIISYLVCLIRVCIQIKRMSKCVYLCRCFLTTT